MEERKETRIKTQDQFEGIYQFYSALEGAGADHIVSPCHPLKRMKHKLFAKLRENGDIECKARLRAMYDKEGD